ncbi:MAG: DUF4270 domain-containing protein [Bacteroidaceae bacterium]|nr:DUF4270 domain-containing protein [Bacteroidaceae bacterium]
MNIKAIAATLVAIPFLISCDNDTSTLGASIVPDNDVISVEAETFYGTSKSVIADSWLLSRGSNSYLGIYTDPETGTRTDASFLTQFNCIEDYQFPDSVLGIRGFHFDDSHYIGEKPFSASLRLYFTEYIGDPDNAMKIEVWPITGDFSPESRYLPDTDPSQFCDMSGEPLARVSVSPTDYVTSDSLRSLSTYFPNLYISLPDSIAENLLTTYYSEGGREKFKNTPAFIENICKGYYIRCIQGDGTLINVSISVLEIHFKHLTLNEKTQKMELTSSIAEFSGNEEVLQLNLFKSEGNEELLACDTSTYLKSPYGIITELTIPVEEIAGSSDMVNSASVTFHRMNPQSEENIIRAPGTIVMLRKDDMKDFFNSPSTIDNIRSYYTTFDGVNNEYTFNNISRLILACISERAEWMAANGWDADDAAGKAAYAEQYPHWNKVVILPASAIKDASSNILYFNLDTSSSCARLQGGPNGNRIAIKVIKADF